MLDGSRVRARMKVLGLKGTTLAQAMRIDPSTLSKILMDHYPGISLELAELLALHLRVPLCELLKVPHLHTGGANGDGVTVQ